jgi:hypothetical protein
LFCVALFASVPEIVIVYVPAGVPGFVLPPPPPFPPPPHAGMMSNPATTSQRKNNPRSFFRREPRAPKPAPSKTNAGSGKNKTNRAGRTADAEGGTVLNVSVALPPLLVTATGLVLPNEHVGADETTGEMLHESVTLPVYPFVEATVTVACELPPGLTVAGVGAPADRE